MVSKSNYCGDNIYLDSLEPYTVTSYSPDVTTPTTCSSTHKNKKIGVVVMLCIGLFIAIVAGVLYRSGDIETNPGPECE